MPVEAGERVAVWAVLQWWSFARKPVLPGDRWLEHGFNASEAYRAEYHRRMMAERGRWAGGGAIANARDMSIAVLLEEMAALPDLSRVHVLRCDARDVRPIPGAIVYIDGPYEQTTCAYGHAFPRAAQLEVAARWRDAGARVVAISEQEPLHPPGQWWHLELGGPSGFGRTWSAQRREVLTLSRPAAGQLRLGDL